MPDPTGRSPRWTPATGDYSARQLHAMEFIASSLDRIDSHLGTIATSVAGSGPHKPFRDVLSDQLRALGAAIARLGAANPTTTTIDPQAIVTTYAMDAAMALRPTTPESVSGSWHPRRHRSQA